MPAASVDVEIAESSVLRELQGTVQICIGCDRHRVDMSTTTASNLSFLGVDAHRPNRTTAQVEVVIPVYNEEAGLDPSIRRLHDYLDERFPLRWLITIVDNASSDRTWGI